MLPPYTFKRSAYGAVEEMQHYVTSMEVFRHHIQQMGFRTGYLVGHRKRFFLVLSVLI